MRDNYASRDGGGVYDVRGLAYCKVLNNAAGERGGGIFSTTVRPPSAWATQCLIAGNGAKYGGGIYQARATLSTIAGNHAQLDGGGACESLLFLFCVIWGNSAGRSGGDIFAKYSFIDWDFGPPGWVSILRCVVNRQNSVWEGFNLDWVLHSYQGPPSFEDPLFRNPEGGDYHLSEGSPAIGMIRTLTAPFRLPDVDLDFRAWNNVVGCYAYYSTPVLGFETATPTPTPPLPGDVLRDGRIDHLDLFELSMHWQGSGETSQKADLNYDGIVDAADLLLLIELMK